MVEDLPLKTAETSGGRVVIDVGRNLYEEKAGREGKTRLAMQMRVGV